MRPSFPHIMFVVSNCFYLIIGKRIKTFSSLPLISCSLNYMIHVWNNANRNKSMSIIIKIYSPRIAGTFCKYFKLMGRWVQPPYASVYFDAFILRCTWFSNFRMGKYAMNPIKPAIRSPTKII